MILVIILVYFILYLNCTEENNKNIINKDIKYSDINGFGILGSDIELNNINSKLIL